MRMLTRKDVKFSWNGEHEMELKILKIIVSNYPVLKIFNPEIPILVQCDASSEALGCCLMQDGHPVAFASRCLTKTEKKWAQIEKELASIVFCFEKFHYFVYGYDVTVQTDHKSLIPIFSKHLDNVTARLQRMLLKLLKYRINITYLPGKDMVVADTLSRSYIKDEVPDDPELEYVVHCLSNNVSMSEVRKTQFIDLINSDLVLSKVKEFCQSSWSDTSTNLDSLLKLYYKLKENIYLSNGILFLNSKMIVPSALRKEMLQLLHEPHFGIEKTKQRARQIFYWPNMTLDIESFVKCCEICQVNRKAQQKEILISHEIPSRP